MQWNQIIWHSNSPNLKTKIKFLRKNSCCREECEQRDVEVAVTSGVGIALEYFTERWGNTMGAAKATRCHCCLIRMRRKLSPWNISFVSLPTTISCRELSVYWFVSWKIFTENSKTLHVLGHFLWLQGCRLFLVPGFLHFSGFCFPLLGSATLLSRFSLSQGTESPWLYLDPTFLNFPAPGVPEWQNSE